MRLACGFESSMSGGARLAWAFAIMMAAGPVTALPGQERDRSLDAQGSMSLNLIWTHNDRSVLFADSPAGWQRGETRYGGRIALRLIPQCYIGASVASWQFTYARDEPGVSRSVLGQAVMLAPYVQLYPLRRLGAFVRGGAGYVNAWTYEAAGTLIQGIRNSHLARTLGVGIDMPLRPHLALTLSADDADITGDTTFGEATSALIVGIGLTVR